MVEPAGRVFRLYWPVFWRATPQAERAPVQLFSVVGLAFWVRGSGWAVEMIQSALPAVSPLLLSNRTRWGSAEVAAAAGAGAVSASGPVASRADAASASVLRRSIMCRPSGGGWGAGRPSIRA